MMQKLSDFIRSSGAELTAYLSYDYGLAVEKTHTYFSLTIGIPKPFPSKPGQFHLKEDFVYEVAIGSSHKALYSALEKKISLMKQKLPII